LIPRKLKASASSCIPRFHENRHLERHGIRARASSFESWLRRSNPDVLCLQEIKAHPDQIPTGIREIDGYSSYWHGAKGGYSGVSIHVRTSSLGESSLTIPHFDEETRVMQVSAGGLTIINVYTPLGQRSYEQKLGFLESLVRYVDVLQADGERIVLCATLILRTKTGISIRKCTKRGCSAREARKGRRLTLSGIWAWWISSADIIPLTARRIPGGHTTGELAPATWVGVSITSLSPRR